MSVENENGNTAGSQGAGTENNTAGQGQQQQTPSELEVIKAELAESNRKLAALDTERAETERKRLEEEGNFKKLAETAEGRVKELEPLVEQNKTLVKIVNEGIDTEIASWADELKALDPGKKDVAARREWLDKVRPLAAKLAASGQTQSQGQPARPGNRPSPTPSQGTNPAQDAREAQKSKMRGSGLYSF